MTDPFRPLKDAFGRFSTGITVAACRTASGGFRAITVNSFTSVSLEPPLVLWCLETKAAAFADFMASDFYAVSVLSASQQAMSVRFANRRPTPLAPDEYETWESGAPILKGRLAGFDCRIVDRHRSGDHVILVARVLKFDASSGAPLLYFASRYGTGPHVE